MTLRTHHFRLSTCRIPREYGSLPFWPVHSLKQKGRHFDENFDNWRCSKWRIFRQNDDISDSMLTISLVPAFPTQFNILDTKVPINTLHSVSFDKWQARPRLFSAWCCVQRTVSIFDKTSLKKISQNLEILTLSRGQRWGHLGSLLFCPRDDVIKWKYTRRYWPFVRGIHRWPVDSPHKGKWRTALMISSMCAWTNGLRRHRTHYDVSVMQPLQLTWKTRYL